jgi:PadR family transcriptional regulator PadR
MLLLAVLASGPAHGYALSAELRRRTGGKLVVVEGSLYPALQRLEGTGLVTSAWDSGGGRRRRIYELTREGKEALREEIQEWTEFRGCVDSVLRESA